MTAQNAASNDWTPTGNIRGPANVLTIGSVETLPDTDDAYVYLTGESPAQALHFGIPEGEKGDPNVLTVGTVETVLPTEPAEVEITGTSPAQEINFKIPQGVPGPGAAGINKGTGAEVFAGADPGTGIMEFWRLRGAGVTTTSVDANGLLVTTTVTWGDVGGKPATFPPTLPIASSGVTGLDSKQASQDVAIGTKLDASAYTAADVLAKVKTVDGPGSGLDADVLDGQDGAYYLAWGNFTGKPSTFPPTLPIAESDVTGLVADLAAKAPLASPAFTGNPTGPTQATADTTTKLATTAFVKAAITATPAPPALATVSPSAPASPQTGALWWNTTRSELTIWDGSAWQVVFGTWA